MRYQYFKDYALDLTYRWDRLYERLDLLLDDKDWDDPRSWVRAAADDLIDLNKEYKGTPNEAVPCDKNGVRL